MSTRSYIGYLQDNVYTGVYCHYDGYIEYNGAVLNENYTDFEKIKKLLSHGDIRVLGNTVENTEYFKDPEEPLKIDEKDIININNFIEFIYIFDVKKCKWYVIDRSKSLKRRLILANALKKVSTESDE